jgi:hypothetical protein
MDKSTFLVLFCNFLFAQKVTKKADLNVPASARGQHLNGFTRSATIFLLAGYVFGCLLIQAKGTEDM